MKNLAGYKKFFRLLLDDMSLPAYRKNIISFAKSGNLVAKIHPDEIDFISNNLDEFIDKVKSAEQSDKLKSQVGPADNFITQDKKYRPETLYRTIELYSDIDSSSDSIRDKNKKDRELRAKYKNSFASYSIPDTNIEVFIPFNAIANQYLSHTVLTKPGQTIPTWCIASSNANNTWDSYRLNEKKYPPVFIFCRKSAKGDAYDDNKYEVVFTGDYAIEDFENNPNFIYNAGIEEIEWRHPAQEEDGEYMGYTNRFRKVFPELDAKTVSELLLKLMRKYQSEWQKEVDKSSEHKTILSAKTITVGDIKLVINEDNWWELSKRLQYYPVKDLANLLLTIIKFDKFLNRLSASTWIAISKANKDDPMYYKFLYWLFKNPELLKLNAHGLAHGISIVFQQLLTPENKGLLQAIYSTNFLKFVHSEECMVRTLLGPDKMLSLLETSRLSSDKLADNYIKYILSSGFVLYMLVGLKREILKRSNPKLNEFYQKLLAKLPAATNLVKNKFFLKYNLVKDEPELNEVMCKLYYNWINSPSITGKSTKETENSIFDIQYSPSIRPIIGQVYAKIFTEHPEFFKNNYASDEQIYTLIPDLDKAKTLITIKNQYFKLDKNSAKIRGVKGNEVDILLNQLYSKFNNKSITINDLHQINNFANKPKESAKLIGYLLKFVLNNNIDFSSLKLDTDEFFITIYHLISDNFGYEACHDNIVPPIGRNKIVLSPKMAVLSNINKLFWQFFDKYHRALRNIVFYHNFEDVILQNYIALYIVFSGVKNNKLDIEFCDILFDRFPTLPEEWNIFVSVVKSDNNVLRTLKQIYGTDIFIKDY